MATKVRVIEKNEGQKIAWKQSTTKLTFGDDELMVNIAKYQKGWPGELGTGRRGGPLLCGAG